MTLETLPVVVLGGGVTGLSVGWASGGTVFEAAATPGGICSSYYLRPGTTERLPQRPADGNAYRFELGGGHWIFGGDAEVLRFISTQTPVRTYRRRSGVYFAGSGTYVPYPLQYHTAALGATVAAQAVAELTHPTPPTDGTMAAWLTARFGPTLTAHFFGPFHERYTAGLWTEIAPQDGYKSPVDPALAAQGARGEGVAAGYNVQFVYPYEGLDALARRLAAGGTVRYGKRAVAIDSADKIVQFADGTAVRYDTLVSTLPLHTTLAMAGLGEGLEADPYTSVLVLNIGAVRSARCPDDYWLYVPDSASGFFRVGCYSNVEPEFLPASARAAGDRVSFYVERAFRGGTRPTDAEVQAYAEGVVKELQTWGFIGEVEAIDPTWIETAYTWSRPGSTWRADALARLEAKGITMVGRYARWHFQGIADSIRDGLAVGAPLRIADVEKG